MTDAPTSQLDMLKGFLEQDPDNLELRFDTAQAAFEANEMEEAQSLLDPLLSSDGANAQTRNLAGLIALRDKRYEAARGYFESLTPEDEAPEAGLAFNLAWTLCHLGDHEAGFEKITPDVAMALPQAAMLRIQLLHQFQRFDDAVEEAEKYVEAHPEHSGLLSAVSTLAMDTDNPDLARAMAERSPEHTDSQVTLATLTLGDGQPDTAQKMFDGILLVKPEAPRAWIGKGIAQMMQQDETASTSLDKGAELFGDHLGSWIAAGWSYAVRGDRETARARFETAMDIDDTFSETHGSLGVLDILDGDMESARQKVRTAMRLDRKCFSAALGQILLLQSQGKAEAANRIFEKAMEVPLDPQGTTMAEAMAKMGLGG